MRDMQIKRHSTTECLQRHTKEPSSKCLTQTYSGCSAFTRICQLFPCAVRPETFMARVPNGSKNSIVRLEETSAGKHVLKGFGVSGPLLFCHVLSLCISCHVLPGQACHVIACRVMSRDGMSWNVLFCLLSRRVLFNPVMCHDVSCHSMTNNLTSRFKNVMLCAFMQ